MALFMLLCIKRQLCTGLSSSQRFTKSWNLIWRKRMAGIRGGWRLTVCTVEKESWRPLSPMIRCAGVGRGHRACVKVCFSVALLWLGGPQAQALEVHSACAYLLIRMNVGPLPWKDANEKYTWVLRNVSLHIFVEKLWIAWNWDFISTPEMLSSSTSEVLLIKPPRCGCACECVWVWVE